MKHFLILVLLLSTLDAFAGYSSSRSSSSRSSSRSSFSSSRSSFSFSSSKPASRPTVFRPATKSFPSAPKAFDKPKIIPLRTTAPLSAPKKTLAAPVIKPIVISKPSSVLPRDAGVRTVVVPGKTKVITRTVYKTQPRYYHNNTYYSYPSVSLSSMMLTAALLSAARSDWTYTAIHIANGTPSRVCECDSSGRVYGCGLWRDEEDYVCKQFRVLPGDQVEWR